MLHIPTNCGGKRVAEKLILFTKITECTIANLVAKEISEEVILTATTPINHCLY